MLGFGSRNLRFFSLPCLSVSEQLTVSSKYSNPSCASSVQQGSNRTLLPGILHNVQGEISGCHGLILLGEK